MSIHKNKVNNTWYVKYQNKTKRGFISKFEAQQYEAKLKLMLIDVNTFVKLHEVANDYLKYSKDKIAYSSYDKLKDIIEKIIQNTENKSIAKVDENDCRKFRDFINTLEYATNYKNQIMNKYKNIFKHGKTFYRIKNDPTYVLVPFKKSFEEKLKKKERESNVWSLEEFEKFISNIDKLEYKNLFLLLYFTGMRLGEALALTWNDFNKGILSISKSVSKCVEKGSCEIKEPKNVSSIRNVPIGQELNEYFEKYKELEMKISGFNQDWFIFGRLSPLPRTNIDRLKRRVIKETNLRYIRIHDLRHSHATNLINEGINIVAVSKRLGHSDINTTLKIYTHLLQKSENQLIDYVNMSFHNMHKQG